MAKGKQNQHVKYHVQINDGEEGNGSVTVDIVQLTGGRRKRKAGWRKYCLERFGVKADVARKFAKELGFKDLV